MEEMTKLGGGGENRKIKTNEEKVKGAAEWLLVCFVFGRSRVQISTRKPAILTEVFVDFFMQMPV
jgi:hypothetical protein